jgi:heme exporter protein D
MSDFLAMGGDAGYVWSAYGITLAVIVANVWWAGRRHRSALDRARGLATVERARKQPTVRQLQ